MGLPLKRALFYAALAVVLATAFLVARAAPGDGFRTGIWPVGLASGLLLVVRPAHRVRVLALVLVVATAAVALGDRPFTVALVYGAIVAAEVALMGYLLRRGRGEASLRTDEDLRRWLTAALVAVFLGASSSALLSLVTGLGDPVKVFLAIAAAHLASQLCMTPFFMALPEQPAIAHRGERLVQWGAILIGTPLLFFPDQAPSLAFLAIPILAWGALRITAFESLTQMIAVVGLATTLTTFDRGPFSTVGQTFGVSRESGGVLLSAFAVTCAVIVIPLVVRVGEYVGSAREAASERDLVRSIVDGATGIAIIVTDPHGRITVFNPGAEQLLGYRAEEVIGRGTRMLHTPESITDKAAELGVEDDFFVVAATLVARVRPGTLMRFVRKDGVERTHAMTLTLLRDSDGTPTGYVSTSEDVTDSLAAQRALYDALEAERKAVDRLRDVDAVKDAFVSTVSHELRTPITSILGYLELLSDGTLGGLGPSQSDALHRVSANSHRLLSLIDDLLTLSQVAEQGVSQERRPFDVCSAVRTAFDVVAPAGGGRDLEVTYDLPDEPAIVIGDCDMLERVVVNLLSNALKFTPDGGSVRVEVTMPGEVVIRVIDTGIGIPEHEQHQLFTRFFRSSLAQRGAIPGSGLGLSISRSIIERHGGSIAVSSEVGVGTTVEVRLPPESADEPGTASQPVVAPDEPVIGPVRAVPRIGNVEDSTIVEVIDIFR